MQPNTEKVDDLAESQVDLSSWRLEVERVLPHLKVVIKADTKVLCLVPRCELCTSSKHRLL